MIRVILEGDPKEDPSTWNVSVDREAQAAGSFCRGVLLVLEVELGPRDGKEVDWQTANRLRQAVRRHVPAIHDLHAASAIDEWPLQVTATLERGSASKAISTRLKAIADEEALLLKVDSNKLGGTAARSTVLPISPLPLNARDSCPTGPAAAVLDGRWVCEEGQSASSAEAGCG